MTSTFVSMTISVVVFLDKECDLNQMIESCDSKKIGSKNVLVKAANEPK
jgi:hypothetical protein